MRILPSALLCLLVAPVTCWVATPQSQQKSLSSSRFFSTASSSQSESSSVASSSKHEQHDDSFINRAFHPTECDNTNRPPSLNILLRSLQQLTSSGSDIRGQYVDHARLGSIASVAHAIGKDSSQQPPLTPLAAYCLGAALGQQLVEAFDNNNDDSIEIALGRDPRLHGTRLADAIARGAESVDSRIRVRYTDIATTPACAAFLTLHNCHAAVMVTASHLPPDRNGLKIFCRDPARVDLRDLGVRAMNVANEWFTKGILPPSSSAVTCSAHVDYMAKYVESLKEAVCRETTASNDKSDSSAKLPLQGLKILLNAGNGSGGFFQQVLQDLGADCSASLHLEPNGSFPHGVPNPESPDMMKETIQACQQAQVDLGILLDTDADRCGFVVPGKQGVDYEPLNRNRLIALLGVLFAQSKPGCAIVTDSVTSEGLATFLQDNLGLVHVRYLKGYMNVINKAKELTSAGTHDVQVAIETSGHCAMQENDYLDDGTYTAVKVVSLLANTRGEKNLLELIADLEELEEIAELRLSLESLEQVPEIFDFCSLEIEQLAAQRGDWEIDTENLEGIRVRTGDNQFFMLRKSLHDPVISLQIEATSSDLARDIMVRPLLDLFRTEKRIAEALDVSVLESY